MSAQLQVTGEAKIRDIQGPVVANSGVITALDGAASQYVRGDGTLADFPTSSGGGSSVSYYLNSSVSQGTIGGVAYRELNKEPIIGAGTDIAISTTGYVASYLTDANDPDVLSIPGGNFNCEFYFSVSNDTGNPFFYAELYKYDGTTFTLLGSSVGVPEYINQGTIIAPYYFAIPVPTSALALTDRLAIRIYVNVDGRTVTLHTENGHLCQVVTTLSKGMVSLNNLTDQSQFLTTGTSGTNFAIVSSGDTHTFNLPIASATNTGKLSSTDWSTFNAKQAALSFTAPLVNTSNTISIPVATNLVDGYLDNTDWTTFNNKQNAITLTTTGTSGAATLVGATLNIPQYQGVLTNPVTGTGTTNTLPKFTGTSAISNSNITDDGSLITLGSNSVVSGNVTIPNASYYRSLTSTGTTVRMLGINSGNVAYVGAIDAGPVSTIFNASSTSLTASFYTSGTEKLTINSVGSVGIGTTSLTGYNLRVSKNITGATTSYGITSDGQIQSGVTNIAYLFSTNTSTQATSFTLTNIVHYNASLSSIGAGSSVTNQFGFLAENNLVGATNNYGFYGNIPAAANRWNLYMNGTANNYMAGALTIGSAILGTNSLQINRGTTGGATANTFSIITTAASDVTNRLSVVSTSIGTQAAAFTLGTLEHFRAQQGTFGAGSAVTTQAGFRANTNLVGATSNIGFWGSIPSAANNWNLFMDGTANNHMAGSLGIGSTSLTGINLRISKTLTGATIAYGALIDGQVQTDVTSQANYFQTSVNTVASTTISSLRHFYASQSTFGAGSTITEQAGFNAESNLIGGTFNYGFRGQIPAGANRWNLYMDGTANNYLAGSLGIGSAGLSTYSLRVAKSLTGATTMYGISSEGTIQSDVTTGAIAYLSGQPTAAAAFTLNNYYHFYMQQGSIGAGSAITNQFGLFVDSTLVGATNNYGVFLGIPSGTNRWNLYASGTANNYLAGSLGIGSTSLTGYTLRTSKNITGAVTSYGVTSEGQIQSDVTSSARMFWTLPSIIGGHAVTDVYHYITGQGTFNGTATNQYGFVASSSLTGATNNFGFWGNVPSGTNRWNIYMQGTAANYMAGNLRIGTTTTDGTSLLEVAGNVNFNGSGSRTVSITRDSGSTLQLQSSVTATGSFIFTSTNGPLNLGANNTNNFVTITTSGQLGVNSTSPNASARLQVDSTTQGFLPPRGTNAQRNAIASPAVGLIFYCTDATEGLYIYTSSGWKSLTMV